jgi:ankyrin repeat protein
LLLTAGADIFIEDAGGQTALHTFYSDVTRAIFQHCLNEIDLWTQDSQGMTSMHYFCWSSRAPADLVSRIQYEEHQFLTSQRPSCFELKDASGRSMLHFATQRGNLELMKLLLRHPRAQKLMEPDYYGRSLLHYAVETSQVGAIDMLLGHNLNLDVRDKEARTLLHHAAMKNSLEAVKHLLHLGVREQVKARDISNRTPLELALAYKSQKVVEYFRHSLIKEDMYDYGSLPMKKQLYSDEFRPPRWRDWIDARVLKTSPEFASLMLGFLTVLLIFLLWW